MQNLKNKIARVLVQMGLSANFLTSLGLFYAVLSGVLIYQGKFFLGGASLLFSGVLDLMDGSVARVSGKTSRFGAILDSCLDRYGDGAVFGGLALYCMRTDRYLYALLAMSAWLGAFLTSYVRARAECLVDRCRVGFWERGEMIACLSLSLFVNNVGTALWILAVATHYTAIQRLCYAAQAARAHPLVGKIPPKPFLGTDSTERRHPVYFVKIILLLILLLVIHAPF